MATETATTQATTTDIEALRASVRGPVICPDDDGYDEARAIWNGDDRPPPAGDRPLHRRRRRVAAVRFARERDLLSRCAPVATASAATRSATAAS